MSIRAPDHRSHPVCMPGQRLAQAEAFHVPQPDSAIPTATGQLCAIGSKSQSQHPVGMSREHPQGSFWLRPRELPQSNPSIEASTGEHAPMGTPSQREYRAALTGESLAVYARVDIPELDGGIVSAAREGASIGGKGQALDV